MLTLDIGLVAYITLQPGLSISLLIVFLKLQECLRDDLARSGAVLLDDVV